LRSGHVGLDRLGQAAAPPSSVMNSRRFMANMPPSFRFRGALVAAVTAVALSRNVYPQKHDQEN
jgi:hypothetical protein